MSAPQDLRGLIPPVPTAEDAARVNGAIRSGDYMPTQIVVFCDYCDMDTCYEYLVGADDSKVARLEVARAYLRTQGWKCDAGGDSCPACAPTPEPTPEPTLMAQHPEDAARTVMLDAVAKRYGFSTWREMAPTDMAWARDRHELLMIAFGALWPMVTEAREGKTPGE